MQCPVLLRQARANRFYNANRRLAGLTWPYTTTAVAQARQDRRSLQEVSEERRERKVLHKLNEFIVPDDLSATLDAHREANQRSLIREVRSGTDEAVARPNELPLPGVRRKKEDPLRYDSLTADFLDRVKRLSKTLLPEDSESVDDFSPVYGHEIRKIGARTARPDGYLGVTAQVWTRRLRRQLLMSFEPGHHIGAEGEWASQMDVIRRVRGILQTKGVEPSIRKVDLDMIMEYKGNVFPTKAPVSLSMRPEPWFVHAKQSQSQSALKQYVVLSMIRRCRH